LWINEKGRQNKNMFFLPLRRVRRASKEDTKGVGRTHKTDSNGT